VASRTYHVINHRDEQIKEEPSTVFHLVLHRATSLERVATTNDERQIVRAELRIAIGRVRIRVTSRSQDGAALDTRLEALLS